MRFRMVICDHCGLRFPRPGEDFQAAHCPACKGTTRAGSDAFERHTIPRHTPESSAPAIYAMLDNIRSAWNVGAIFRTADAAGVKHLYLCGITPTPENAKVTKTSLGSEHAISWSHHKNGAALAGELAAQGHRLWALEGGADARPIGSAPAVDSVTWVIGNENAGIDPTILAVCENIFYLPMMGDKESLNVVIAFGAAVYAQR